MVLVLAVLLGVLGMHGLASPSASAEPGGMTAGHHSAAAHADAYAPHHGSAHHQEHLNRDHDGHHRDRHHRDGDCAQPCGDGLNGGHLDHADSTCAAGGVSGSYSPPALLDNGVTVPRPIAAPGRSVPGGMAVRAPPDLAELQLLRI